MITKYFALPFTKKFQLKQASPRPRGYFQICFAYESLPNLNIKHHLVFGNEKKQTNKLQNVSFLFKCYLFWCIFRNPCTACNFFLIFFLCSWCWNVVRWEGWERQKHTTEQADVSLHYCIQEWQWGWGSWRSETKTKEDMYNHLCGQETERQPSDGLWCLPMPHILAAFFIVFFFCCFFLFISLNIQIIRTILSCQIKKIYRGSLGFFPLPKKGMVNTFRENKQQLKIRASI